MGKSSFEKTDASAPNCTASHSNRIMSHADGENIVSVLGTTVRNLRVQQNLTLEQLAKRSNVSRAMLSKVERSEKSPTLSIIVRIATGLNVTLSTLLGSEPNAAETSIVKANDRVKFKDPKSGFEREVLSPSLPNNRAEIVIHRIPVGQDSGLLPSYAVPTEKFVIVQEGELTVHTGKESHVVSEGDTLFFEVHDSYLFSNSGDKPLSYYVIIIRKQ